MTDLHNTITPPPELFKRWENLPRSLAFEAAYRAGADQELEACCEWVANYCPYFGDYPMPEEKLRATRRPKPPSLAEEALQELERTVILLMPVTGPNKVKRFAAIRRALERLQELENNG